MSRLSIKSLLSYTFSTYFNNFTTLAPLAIVTGFFTFLFIHIPTVIGSYLLTPADLVNTAQTLTTSTTDPQSVITQVLAITKQSALLQHSSNILHTIVVVGLTIILAITYMLVYFSFLKVLLNFSKEKKPTICSLFKWDNSLVKALAGSLLYWTIICGILGLLFGLFASVYFVLNKLFALDSLIINYQIIIAFMIILIAFIISVTTYIGARFFTFIFIVLDQNSGIKEALKKSWYLTKGSIIKIILGTIIISAISGFIAGILGFLTLSISLKITTYTLITKLINVLTGSVVTIPLVGLSFVNIYQQLTQK